jgi:putative ABC transport system ATP-binding protein
VSDPVPLTGSGLPLIKLDGIVKAYRDGDVTTTALDGISLRIEPGEFVAVMGPSGCGKSTLLNILGLLDGPDSGSYFLEGREVSRLPERDLTGLRKSTVGFVFQNFQLVEELSAAENIGLLLAYHDIPKKKRLEMVERALELVGLSARRNARPAQLSGGQQQRIAVARAIVANPKLILADEPTGNLDSKSGDEIIDMLERLNRAGTTVAMVTHSPSHAARARRIVNMLDGRIVSAGEQVM